MKKILFSLILTFVIVVSLLIIPRSASAEVWTPWWFDYYWGKLYRKMHLALIKINALLKGLTEVEDDAHRALLTSLYYAGVKDNSIVEAKLSSNLRYRIRKGFPENGSKQIDFASIAAQTCVTDTVPLNCTIEPGDITVASPLPVAGGVDTLDLTWSSWVSDDNTVTIRVCNPTSGALDPALQTWNVNAWYYCGS